MELRVIASRVMALDVIGQRHKRDERYNAITNREAALKVSRCIVKFDLHCLCLFTPLDRHLLERGPPCMIVSPLTLNLFIQTHNITL
jgi:hypothetical protein